MGFSAGEVGLEGWMKGKAGVKGGGKVGCENREESCI